MLAFLVLPGPTPTLGPKPVSTAARRPQIFNSTYLPPLPQPPYSPHYSFPLKLDLGLHVSRKEKPPLESKQEKLNFAF